MALRCRSLPCYYLSIGICNKFNSRIIFLFTMSWILLGITLCIILLKTHVALADDYTGLSDFDIQIQSEPFQCFTCKSLMTPWSTARGHKLFTCSHGRTIHQSCSGRFYDSIGPNKRCPSRSCKHSPLIDPFLPKQDIVAFYNVYKTILPTGDTPGLCTGCQQPLYVHGSPSLIMRSETFRVCDSRKHVFHPRCVTPVSSFRCTCSRHLTDYSITLEGTIDRASINQYTRLNGYYNSLQLFVEPIPENDLDTFSSLYPAFSSAIRVAQHAIQQMQQALNAVLHPSALRNPASTIAARLRYNTAIAQIEATSTKHEHDQFPKCIICHNVIAGEMESAAATYTEELKDGEAPTDHFQQMHLACAEYEVHLRHKCPICRRNVLKIQ